MAFLCALFVFPTGVLLTVLIQKCGSWCGEGKENLATAFVRAGYSRESGSGGPVVVGVALLGEADALGRPDTLAVLLPH